MALLNSYKQFAADDRSYAAQQSRATTESVAPSRTAWWYDSSGTKQTKALTGDLANATGVSTKNGKLVVSGPFGQQVFGSDGKVEGGEDGSMNGEAPPKFNVIAKDPLIDKAAKAGLAGAQASNQRASTMYEDWLNKFKQESASSDARLAKETSLYDTAATNLRAGLASNEEMTRRSYDALSANDVLKARGDAQGRALGTNASAGVPMGASSEEMKIYGDSIARALLPYKERLGMLNRENLLQGYNADISTAPLSRNAYQQASMARLLPINTGLSLFGQQQQNLGQAANLLSSNESVWSNDPRLVPNLPTPSGGAQSAGVPNYGGQGTAVRPVSNYYFGGQQNPAAVPTTTDVRLPSSTATSAAEHAYYNKYGFYPAYDPEFSQDRYLSVGGRVAPVRPYARQDSLMDYPPNRINTLDLPIEGLER